MTAATERISPGQLLRQTTFTQVNAEAHLWGFGGFHGGLALALMTSAWRAQAQDLTLRSATARFHRPLDGAFQLDVSVVRAGRTTTTLAARASTDKGLHVEGTAVFGATRPATWPTVAPPPPAAPPATECEIFTIPPDFVPVSTFLEIRPVGPNRPYAGGTEPELIAWMRLLEDDDPPDASRLMFLMDALAPAYSAMLSDLALLPTVELTVAPGAGLSQATSPWVLVRARATMAGADGWHSEDVDVWTPEGVHLGSARQLRFIRGG